MSKLTDLQKHILVSWFLEGQPSDNCYTIYEWCHLYSYLEEFTELPKKTLQKEIKALRGRGFVRYVKGLINDDGEVCGSGHCLNSAKRLEIEALVKEFKESDKNKHYFTFGQTHVHNRNGTTFDKDCVVEIIAPSPTKAREKMFNVFGQRWAFQYKEVPDMIYYPRGIIKL